MSIINKINYYTFFKKDDIVLNKQNMIPPLIGDIFETIGAKIFKCKRVSTGLGKGISNRCDLAKDNYLIEVKATCNKNGTFKIFGKQLLYFSELSRLLLQHNGNFIYTIFYYDYDWKDCFNKHIDKIVIEVINSIKFVIITDHSTLAKSIVNKCINSRVCYSYSILDFDFETMDEFQLEINVNDIMKISLQGYCIDSEQLNLYILNNIIKCDTEIKINIDTGVTNNNFF